MTNHWIKVGYITQKEDENNEGYVVTDSAPFDGKPFIAKPLEDYIQEAVWDAKYEAFRSNVSDRFMVVEYYIPIPEVSE